MAENTGSQVFKLMRGVQESLAGRAAVSLSQAEIYGGVKEPFIIDMEALAAREASREEADAKEIDLVLEHDAFQRGGDLHEAKIGRHRQG